MRRALRHPIYARLFGAQVAALIGTGLLTVALGLLAFDIASGNAGMVLGSALTIRIIAYVTVSPVMTAAVTQLPRTTVLVGADVVRVCMSLALPFITQAWQIYVLIFALQAASATFSPAFQATIPQVLPDEEDYTAALSLSRLAYDLESLLSPVLAAALLAVMSYHDLFIGTAIGFLISIGLVLWARPPVPTEEAPSPFVERLTRGLRLFIRTPELRGLMALNVVMAAVIAMALVNTVVLVQGQLGGTQAGVAWLLAGYGAGSMAIALVLPCALRRIPDHAAMTWGGVMATVGLVAAAAAIRLAPGSGQWVALMATWGLMGAATSLIATPSPRLLRRNSTAEEQPAVFAAQFSLSHACYLITYPAAGWLGLRLGLAEAALVLAALAGTAALAAAPLGKGRARLPFTV